MNTPYKETTAMAISPNCSVWKWPNLVISGLKRLAINGDIYPKPLIKIDRAFCITEPAKVPLNWLLKEAPRSEPATKATLNIMESNWSSGIESMTATYLSSFLPNWAISACNSEVFRLTSIGMWRFLLSQRSIFAGLYGALNTVLTNQILLIKLLTLDAACIWRKFTGTYFHCPISSTATTNPRGTGNPSLRLTVK